MKIGHWTMYNKSGMNRVAESIVEAERKLGLDSHLCNIQENTNWDNMIDCDIHVSHTHFPDIMRKKITKPLKLVWVGHGTPEHVFQSAVETGLKNVYGHGDAWMLVMYWLQNADAIVTFWSRHRDIWQSLCDKNTKVDLVPLGIDIEFWKSGVSKGKFAGEPSLFTAENPHYIKWPLDLFILWNWVVPKVNGNPILHCTYLARDLHRWFFPLVNRNGSSYASHISPIVFGNEELRNTFKSVDYYIGLVRYGDFNRISLEANVAGCKTISYRGNPYSDYWVTEGDQRIIASELIDILNGVTEPRKKEPVPDIIETAKSMKAIYERLM